MTSRSTPKAPKPVKAWAILDEDGLMHDVCVCDSQKFIWRRFSGLRAYNEEATKHYKSLGYRCIRVLITPL